MANIQENLQTPMPKNIFFILPLMKQVLFPNVLLPINVTRKKSQELIRKCVENQNRIAIFCQKDDSIKIPSYGDLYPLGTTAVIREFFEMRNGSLLAFLEGCDRVMLTEEIQSGDFLQAKVITIPDILPDATEQGFSDLVSDISDRAIHLLEILGQPAETINAIKHIEDPCLLVNYISSHFPFDIADKQQLLEYEKVHDRAVYLHQVLSSASEHAEVEANIKRKTEGAITKQQREYFLQQQMKEIQKELGDGTEKVIEDMRERAKQKKWSEQTAELFEEELRKLERIPTQSPEYSTQQNYLEIMLDLPWNEGTTDNFDLHRAQEVLDRDHYGMEKIKERIIEYLAVLSRKGACEDSSKKIKTPILCLYGPPGVGKTSLGKSIADALERKYARISLGGLHDEAELRGHRRTYIGAMPGRIIENIRKVKTNNPVFILDEIDKIGTDYKGDPTSALLEILDPEQNNTFHDNFLNVDYDLSQILFIATANSLQEIPAPLLDRMEIIEMSGYSEEEKVEIALRHLTNKELQQNGLNEDDAILSADIIRYIIEHYTRESGVRSLDRQISTVMRKVVTQMVKNIPYNQQITKEDIITYLGQPQFMHEEYEGNQYVGVVTGLAWTRVGGEILCIETSLSPSKTPTLQLTGNLGDIMKESATLAMGYIRSHAVELGIASDKLDTTSVHIHVPEGAVPKDGPSAGITITTALVSAFTGRHVRQGVAMTGEMTLRGKVLPIGGLKEKLLAAKRAGITDIVLCEDNRRNVLEIPQQYLQGLTLHFATDINQVLEYALLDK